MYNFFSDLLCMETMVISAVVISRHFDFFDYLYHIFQTYQFIKVHAICISSKVLPNAMLFLHARLYQNCPMILIFLSLIQFF